MFLFDLIYVDRIWGIRCLFMVLGKTMPMHDVFSYSIYLRETMLDVFFVLKPASQFSEAGQACIPVCSTCGWPCCRFRVRGLA